MHRLLRTRRLPGWWVAVPGWWRDAALAAVLSIATWWLTVDPIGGGDGRPLDLLTPGELRSDAPAAPPGLPDQPGGTATQLVLNLLATVPLIGRRRWPLACLAVQFAGMLFNADSVNLATVVALLVGAYSLAVYGRSTLRSMSALLVAGAVTAGVKNDTWPELPGWAGVFALLLPIGLFGVAIRTARSRARASTQRAEALERGQEAATRLAVAEERARIARELHDVVSHHVSMMTIQAGAAGKILDADPVQARSALSAIETSGRETMTELRHLLGVLTPGPVEPAGEAGSGDARVAGGEDPLHPQPGLDRLDALIEKVRQAGQPVSVRQAPVELPRGVDLTAYRVVQEALTNALRYAPGARTGIAITTEPAAAGATPHVRTDLVIEVTNDAPPPGAPPDSPPGGDAGSGTGLLGLAERLRLYRGTLETGRRVGGGFRVLARIPLAAGPRPESPREAA